MTATRIRAGLIATALSAVLLGGMAAAPASAEAAPATTGSFEFNCAGTPGGGARVSWERVGTTYTATIDEYRLSPANGKDNNNGEVHLVINGGPYTTTTKLRSDGGWYPLRKSVTANVASGASIENAFTFVYSGFPSYPSCSASKWL